MSIVRDLDSIKVPALQRAGFEIERRSAAHRVIDRAYGEESPVRISGPGRETGQRPQMRTSGPIAITENAAAHRALEARASGHAIVEPR